MTKYSKYKRMLLLILMLCILSATGCERLPDLPMLPLTSKQSTEKQYTIYYLNASGTKLEERKYTPVSDTFDGILQELLQAFVSPEETALISALPPEVSVSGYSIGVDNLTVDFHASYLSMTNIQEVLLRAGLVKTLVQLPGVLKISFTIEGQPLTDVDGTVIPAMDENSFIDSKNGSINSYQYTTLNLYFPNMEGTKVVRELRNVYYSSNLIPEKVIVEQLIHGPANMNLLPVADPSVLIRSVKISKGICVIDLDEKFNDSGYVGNAQPETCIYAFVNSISEACDVSGVQFMINGQSDVRFRDTINLDQVFYWNADYNEMSGESKAVADIFLDEKGIETEIMREGSAMESEAESESETSDHNQVSAEEATALAAEHSEDSLDAQGNAADNTDGQDNSLAETDQPTDFTLHGGVEHIGVGVDPSLVEERP